MTSSVREADALSDKKQFHARRKPHQKKKKNLDARGEDHAPWKKNEEPVGDSVHWGTQINT